ncbi:MAG: NifB/NifX family molybdenum-iron cluster-binding protein [Bacteroidota bacterium]
MSLDDTSSKIHEHFGKCDYFAILDVDGDKIVSIDYLHNTETKRSR